MSIKIERNLRLRDLRRRRAPVVNPYRTAAEMPEESVLPPRSFWCRIGLHRWARLQSIVHEIPAPVLPESFVLDPVHRCRVPEHRHEQCIRPGCRARRDDYGPRQRDWGGYDFQLSCVPPQLPGEPLIVEWTETEETES